MNILIDEANDLNQLRQNRLIKQQNLLTNIDGESLLVIKSTFLSDDRRYHYASYAVLILFLELKQRLVLRSFTYTFNKEGLIFYINVSEKAETIKKILINYEDNHPLGFAIISEVYSNVQLTEVSRSQLGAQPRYLNHQDLGELVNLGVVYDKEYRTQFRKSIEKTMLDDSYEEVLTNIALFGLISANTKPYGFGCLSPNSSSLSMNLNYNQFIKVLEVFKSELRILFKINTLNLSEVLKCHRRIEDALRVALHTQRAHFYMVFLIVMLTSGFINSRSYADMSSQIKSLYLNLYNEPEYKNYLDQDDSLRYYFAKNGFKEGFGLYLNFFQKHRLITPAFLYILSKNEDQYIIETSGYQALQKAQFLSKNLVFKEAHWEEFDQWCNSNHVTPYDSTQVMAAVVMLDFMQRNYAKIKAKQSGER